MVRGAPNALTCFFVGFRTDFVTSVRVSVASAGVLVLAGGAPKTPNGRRTPFPPPPPPSYVPGGCCVTVGLLLCVW